MLRLTLAGLAYLPALAVLAAVAALAVALRAPWIAWLSVTFVIVSLYLGGLLRLPQWLLDISPVSHITAPTDYSPATLTALLLVAAAVAALAGSLYRQRDAV